MQDMVELVKRGVYIKTVLQCFVDPRIKMWPGSLLAKYVRRHYPELIEARRERFKELREKVETAEKLMDKGMRKGEACKAVGINIFRYHSIKQGMEERENRRLLKKARKMAGLGPTKRKKRKCLRCGIEFRSYKNRLCPKCRKEIKELEVVEEHNLPAWLSDIDSLYLI